MSSQSRFHEGSHPEKQRNSNSNSARSARSMLTRVLHWLLWF